MDYTTLCLESQETATPSASKMQSLYEICQQVVDGRRARGKRYDVAGVLVVLVVAKLAGMTSILGASQWIEDQATLLREGLHLPWKRMPCANTYSYVLARLDSQKVNATLAAWFVRQEAQSRCGEEPSRLVEQASQRRVHLAIDGKVLKGTGKQVYGGENPQKQVLHIYEVHTGIVLQQCPIATKHNARQHTQTLVDGGAVQRTHSYRRCRAELSRRMARLVQQAGGDVVLFIKDNTPVTRADLELFFEDAEADRRTWQTFEQVEKGHGRLERRHIITSPDLNEYLARDWGEVGQVFRLQRERTSKDKHSVEVVYGWTSLPRKRCSPQELLQLTRDHWSVENRLHWRRDATLGEDRCGVRFPPVAQMLAVLNTVVLSLMDAHHVTNVARQIRHFASHPGEALAWLLCS